MKRLFLSIACSAVVLAACKDNGGPQGGEVRWNDAGADFAIADKVAHLPAGELKPGEKSDVTRDNRAPRYAYTTSAGDERVVYLVGDGVYFGARQKAPIDFSASPDLEHAAGALFENAGDRRDAFVADLTKALGEPGLVRMLVDGGGAPDKAWDAVFAKLSDARKNDVRTGLAGVLEKDKPTQGLARAVTIVPLKDPARAPVLDARVRETAVQVHAPRAAAVMLRALSAIDKPRGATAACEILGKSHDTEKSAGAELDVPGHAALVESALLAIASDAYAGHPTTCKGIDAYLGEDMCEPFFRCAAGTPLTGREPTKQDEALCTKDEIGSALKKELDRDPKDVIALTSQPRPGLYAYATLLSSDKVPASFALSHARRRYAVTQPDKPGCDSGAPPGTPCRCSEAMLRDQSCRVRDSATIHVSLCQWDVDDKTQKIANVTAALAP